MKNVRDILKEKGIVLPPPPPKGGMYTQAVPFGDNLCYISGCGSDIDYQGREGAPENSALHGRLGATVSVEEGQACAKNAMLNLLAVIDANIGLDKVKRVVKLLVFVGSTPDFYAQPQVANGGSALLLEIFGEAPARSAIGCVSLPGDQPVEIEALIELEK